MIQLSDAQLSRLKEESYFLPARVLKETLLFLDDGTIEVLHKPSAVELADKGFLLQDPIEVSLPYYRVHKQIEEYH